MTTIIKYPVPNQLLFELLIKICEIDEQQRFVLNKVAYKRASIYNLIQPFCDTLINYYRKNKHTYLDNSKMNFNRFITIIRQICNANNISYTSKLVYGFSTYETHYYIFKSFNEV